ncbi:pentatricopeptide repeat-containing protein [Tanacetum coccineum]
MPANHVTFAVVLSACDHMGLVKEGSNHFESMANYGVEPGLEHYACMVSLLSRAGKLYEDKDFIEKLPIPLAAAIIWRILLSACSGRVVGNLEIGEYAAEMTIWNNHNGSYILLSNTVFFIQDILAEIFNDNKRSRSIGLKANLRSLKLGDLSIDAYFHKIESIATILATFGSPISKDDIVNIVGYHISQPG